MALDTQNRTLSDDELTRLYERTSPHYLITTEEAAALLRLRPQTLRRWACENSGPLKPRRIGGRLRWLFADVKSLAAGESVAA
jgi:hypothetical protein